MLALRSSFRLSPRASSVFHQLQAGLQVFQQIPNYDNIEYPEKEKLRVMEKVPQYPPGIRAFTMQKKLRFMRGVEPYNNFLMHKQYGIVATGGGRMKHVHFENIRMIFNRNLDYKRMFAMWRVPAPWQPISKKSQGQRMGGGKSGIDHYATPVKAGRVIVEVGGMCEYFEVKEILKNTAGMLPFDAKAVSYEEMEKDRKEEERLERENLNPYTFKYIIQNNLGGCHNWITQYDRQYFGKHL